MITELMKRDPAINLLPYAVAGALIVGALCRIGDAHIQAVVLDSISFAPLVLLSLVLPHAQQAGARFVSHLPVTVRAFYLSQVFSTLLLLWVPTGILMWGGGGVNIVPMVAGSTLVALFQQGKVIRMRSRAWVLQGLLFVLITTWLITAFSSWMSWQGSFCVACGAVSVGAFVQTWNTLPSTFLIADTRAPVQSPGETSVRLPLIYPRAYLIWLPVSFAQMTFSTGNMGLMFVAFWWLAGKPWSSWLCGLPVSRSRLLAKTMLPVIGVCVAGFLASAYLPWNSRLAFGARVRFLNVVFVCAMVMMLSMLGFVSDWYRFRRLRRGVRTFLFSVGIGVCVLLVASDLLSLIWNAQPPVRTALQWLAGMLPGWKLAVVLVPLPLLYLAADKVFREMENTAAVPPIIARQK